MHRPLHGVGASAERTAAQPQPRGEWSSGSGFYYGPNDKTFCASVHVDSAPTAARDAVQSPLVSVLLTPVTGRLESGISLVMIFPSCPSLIGPKACWTLLSFCMGGVWGSLSELGKPWLELGNASTSWWVVQTTVGVAEKIWIAKGYSIFFDSGRKGAFFCEAGIFPRFIAKPGTGGWQAAQLLGFTLHREPGGRLFCVPWLPQNSSARG